MINIEELSLKIMCPIWLIDQKAVRLPIRKQIPNYPLKKLIEFILDTIKVIFSKWKEKKALSRTKTICLVKN